ncbi:carboxypeptidase-like regulatory domain-containing protein [Flavobacterium sp. H122]|uniref:carboxypeptidase-like regulatory domain-containing protein n=1 Tax=Flavobacterium sp. H122 TaxID=2529860 RepID=UPI0010A9AD1B|nr:carboxypeptidase-like regulatory domain-containing protein [Flavobacterium sp. H122]
MAKIKFILFLFFFVLVVSAQSISIKIIDSKNDLPLPHVNIKLSNNIDLISNDEGVFNLSAEQKADYNSITVSYLGYQTQKISVKDLKQQNLTVKLTEVVYQLNEVAVNNAKPNPGTIMSEVKKRLNDNYATNDNTIKRSFFLREGIHFNPSQINVDINKSTGFSKKKLKEVDREVNSFCNNLKSNPSKKYEDLLLDYYQSNKPKIDSKINVIKATSIKGDGSSTSMEDFQKKGLSILLKHLDSTKFYRIKSGWFGSRDTISFKSDSKKEEDKISNLANTKLKVNTFLFEQKFSDKSKFDFIYNPELYEYSYNGKLYDDETDDLVYILSFSPKKSKAKYTGKLYVSGSDYAVVKCNYYLAEGKIVDGLNLKMLFGIKVKENISNGTLIFKKTTDKKAYELQYALEENGQYFYLNRPVKFVELKEGEKDVLDFDLKIEGDLITKTELLSISKDEIAQNTFDGLKEKEFNYINLKQYNSKIWDNHISIEPLEVMKQYKAL